MKKLLTFFLTLAMLLSMAACGNTGNTQPSETEPTQTNDVVPVDDVTENPEDRVVTVVDMSGDEVTITGKVENCKSLACWHQLLLCYGCR